MKHIDSVEIHINIIFNVNGMYFLELFSILANEPPADTKKAGLRRSSLRFI